MLIRIKPNPLCTEVILDETEKLVLWARLYADAISNKLFTVKFSYQENDKSRFEAELQEIEKYYGMTFEKHADLYLESSIEALRSFHVGDCTCVASTCSKCYAESYVGYYTHDIPKHPGHHIFQASFTVDRRLLEEDMRPVMEELSKKVVAEEPWHELYVKKWQKEKDQARAYMEKHLKEHGFDGTKKVIELQVPMPKDYRP